MFKFIIIAVAFTASARGFRFHGHEYDRTALGDAIDKTSLKLLKLISSYGGLSRMLSEMDPNFLTVANKIYVGDKYVLNDMFSSTARLYGSEVEVIDFKDVGKAANVINQWASEKTKGHIPSPIDKDTIDPDAAAALFNVIFFKGNWHVPFNASETEDKDFHVDSTTIVKKPTMRLTQSLFYTKNKDLGARMVELPYKEGNFRMVIVLPDQVDGLPSVLNKAAEKGLLEDIFRLAPAGRDVNLELPRFEVKSSLDLNDLLPKIGVSEMFEEPAPGVVKNDSVVVSNAFQEAFIKVNEEGATAGAFTGVVVVPLSDPPRIPQPIHFQADHPFLYLILNQDKILFAGMVLMELSSWSSEPEPIIYKANHPFLYFILSKDKMLFAGTFCG